METLHAYTCPRPGSSQIYVKDLLDLSLLVTDLHLPPSRDVWAVEEGMFARYTSHALFPFCIVSPGRLA
ncbi:hypothetical protein [Deinococcus sp. 12RED42]|uniref:hypothetical protein n=1 Tax=Deinococcus sp. 12RED42 TaxID=2745872 RepID=UPI001E35582F|nr:hypothetical protein [Deinococcus sp. 12RED42]MCD0164250.1 hypothetical protein [Deinococcus sp. 12RED42]